MELLTGPSRYLRGPVRARMDRGRRFTGTGAQTGAPNRTRGVHPTGRAPIRRSAAEPGRVDRQRRGRLLSRIPGRGAGFDRRAARATARSATRTGPARTRGGGPGRGSPGPGIAGSPAGDRAGQRGRPRRAGRAPTRRAGRRSRRVAVRAATADRRGSPRHGAIVGGDPPQLVGGDAPGMRSIARTTAGAFGP